MIEQVIKNLSPLLLVAIFMFGAYYYMESRDMRAIEQEKGRSLRAHDRETKLIGLLESQHVTLQKTVLDLIVDIKKRVDQNHQQGLDFVPLMHLLNQYIAKEMGHEPLPLRRGVLETTPSIVTKPKAEKP